MLLKKIISCRLGITLASQWKSQFDDSEETDNEWKGEHLQSPEHRHHSTNQVRTIFILRLAFSIKTELKLSSHYMI